MASSLWPLLSFAIAVITYCSSICAAAASQPAVAAPLRSRRLLSEEEAPYGYCMSPALRFYTTNLEELNPRPHGGCNQPRLRPEDRPLCRRCAAQGSRGECLATQGRVWNQAADSESCLWITPGEKEVVTEQRVAYALNTPSASGLYVRVAASVSSLQFEHRQRQGLGWQDFHVATFSARGAPAESYEDDEPPLPQGLRPERACLFTRKDDDLQCSFTYSNAPGNAYLLLSKQFYTDNARILREVAANKTCNTRNPRQRCVGTTSPFLYEMRMTEKFGSPSSTVQTQSTRMFGLDEKAIGPGGGSYVAPREYWYDLTGATSSSWSITMEQPMLVLLLNSSSLRTCPNAADGLVACDFNGLRELSAVEPCYSAECSGSHEPSSTREIWYLHISYPLFFNSVPFDPVWTPQVKVVIQIESKP
ncbi:hypothetical protein ABPG77_009318 [Micractinium sp. CCAP 211/92]